MSWKVLYIRSRTEKKIAEYADVFDVPYYLPLRRESKVYQRRRVDVDKPVFPGYFFASIDMKSDFKTAISRYMLQIIDPPDERNFLHELAQIRKALIVDPGLGTAKALCRGRRVTIDSGPFAGIEGVVWSMKGQTKVRLNVEIVGQAVVVEVDAAALSVIS